MLILQQSSVVVVLGESERLLRRNRQLVRPGRDESMYPQQGVVAPSGVAREISAATTPATPVLGAVAPGIEAVNPVRESQPELETQGVVAPTVPAPSHSQSKSQLAEVILQE